MDLIHFRLIPVMIRREDVFLVIENRIKGRPIIENLEDWFKNAHGIQQIVFENLFTKETLKSWQ